LKSKPGERDIFFLLERFQMYLRRPATYLIYHDMMYYMLMVVAKLQLSFARATTGGTNR
jgi:hypothetical protein